MKLSGQQRKKLHNALVDAFPTKSLIEQLLYYELDKNLDAIAKGSSLQEIVFNLIKRAESEGWIQDLIVAVYRSNPSNSSLAAISQELLTNYAPKTTSDFFSSVLRQSTQQQKILILAAMPDRLHLDNEIQEMEDAIKRAVRRELFEIKIRTTVRPQDIRRAIAQERPQIVHFCGHGIEDGSLLLEDDKGNNKPVSPNGLASLFQLHNDYVKCVLLNACYSERSAEAISQHINYVIGMNLPIQDRAAIAFAQGFYDGLGYGMGYGTSSNQDVFERAFKEGTVALQLENFSQGLLPVLKSKVKQQEVSPLMVIAEKFLKQAGASTNRLDKSSLQVTSIKGSLNTYAPIPVMVASNQPTGKDVVQALEYAKQLNNKRQSHLGILLYNELPDALFRLRMAEVRMSEHFVLIPIPLVAIEQALLDSDTCPGLLASYVDRYLGNDLFDDRNAIGDALSFFGREKILNRLEAELKKRQGIGLFGLRKSGKTSLLLQISFALRPHPVVHIDLQPYGGKLYYGVEIFNQILHQLYKIAGSQNFQSFNQNLPAANVAVRFTDLVNDIAQILQEKGYELPVICLLDEVERIFPFPTDPREKVEEFNAVFGALRALSQEKRQLGLLVADVHPDCNRINHWIQPGVPTNPVFNFFKEEFVSSFSFEDTKAMIDGIGKLMGRLFDDETLIAIHRKSGGHPFISRQLASLLCTQIPVERDGRITGSLAQKYLEKPFIYSGILKDYIGQSIWGDLTKRNFESVIAILRLLACNEKPTKDSIPNSGLGAANTTEFESEITDSDILSYLSVNNFTENQCLDALLWLESVGLVTRQELEGQTRYQIHVKLLSSWLRMQMTKREIEQWQIN